MRIGILLCALVLAAPRSGAASSIALFGNDSNTQLETFLEGEGHVVTNYGFAAPDAAKLAGVDVMLALRNIGGNVNAFVNNGSVQGFLTGGGLLIAEWNAAEWVIDTVGLVDADAGPNVTFGSPQPITFTAAGTALGLADGINNPFTDGTRTDNQWALTNLGAGVQVLATRPGDMPVMIGTTYGQGYILVNALEWADAFGAANADTQGWLLDAVGAADAQTVPEPQSLALLAVGVAALAHRAFRGWLARRARPDLSS